MAIKAEKLTKIFVDGNKQKTALDDFSLEIPQGSFFGLLGPNGAGKSTFINILAGLVKKTSGNVFVFGNEIEQRPRTVAHMLGIVPQEIVFDPFFTVKECLEIYADFYDVPKEKRKTEEIMESLGLSDKADSKPRKLSGGMKRRLLIAKALVHAPKILILDEPTAGVDISLRKQLWAHVKELNRQGTTIILTTHYLEEAESLCDEIAIIDHGKIVKCDKKENLIHLIDFKQLKVTFASELFEIPDNLTSIVANVKRLAPNEILIEYASRQVAFARILEILYKIPSDIVDISTKEADLERVFSHLIDG